MKLGLKPLREHVFVLTDSTRVVGKISERYIILPQGEEHTPVILGKEGDQAVLGAVTLKMLRLVLDPFKRELKLMRITSV
ncbi:MAG: hypothetical protein QXQ80_04045 [Nitrososphaerota archaeon]